MIRKIRTYLSLLLGIIAMLGIMAGCGKISGPSKEEGVTETPEEDELIICWHLKSFCGEEVDIDIYIDLKEDGNFAIYQRSESMSYTVFKGTYTLDEESSILTGVYEDGTPWANSYLYTLDSDAKELTLESIENLGEVSIYEQVELPITLLSQMSRMKASDVKPL